MSKKNRDSSQRNETLATLLMPVFEEKLEISLGNRLRDLRRQPGLSLRALAESSGLSANTLSLIENGKTSPSVATLQQIALALNIPITSFFEVEVRHDPVIFTRNDQRTGSTFAHGQLEELGTGLGNDGLQPFVVTIKPHGSSGTKPLTHDGIEFIFCLDGQVNYLVMGDPYVLNPGDSLLYKSQIPHGWFNPNEQPARLLIILSIMEDHHVNHNGQLIYQDYSP